MYDGQTCRKPSAHFVLLQDGVADISIASLEMLISLFFLNFFSWFSSVTSDRPTNFDSQGVLKVTDPSTTADIDQRSEYVVFGYSSSSVGYIGRDSLTESVSETVVDEPTKWYAFSICGLDVKKYPLVTQ
ncbi:hypothetical protein KIN20_022572 [Parelaphostrongylus tenuis]|uniref:Uncharacterized protein n=1 Tax=Parelaphostrongylus tenuis TaxID=148309 RepID=A0AAD5MQR8_PARTN|nr:hypothetical protein KIN20_022572 [Parelaphostrongylus tenuis]